MKKLILLLFAPLLVTACLDDDSHEMNDTFVGNFEACWQTMDEHYCFFQQKGIDWDSVHDVYLPLFRDSVVDIVEEFGLMGEMLSELRDGHVNLYSPFNTARYWKWYEDYELNFDENLLYRYYLGQNYWIASGMHYTMFRDSVAYLRYASFSSAVGEANLDYVLAALRNAKGLIIDVRDNGGGSLTNVPAIASRFATKKVIYGYMQHKVGRGHNDFSELQPLSLEPDRQRYHWDASQQPVVVLTNRHCFSACNSFVAAMRALDGIPVPDSAGVMHPLIIKTMGDRTGGGGGMPFESVLPNGWTLRFSACPITDHLKRHIEEGIDPDMTVMMDSLRAFELHADDIIDSARTYIILNTLKEYPDKKTE